jgi:hypothetical protein
MPAQVETATKQAANKHQSVSQSVAGSDNQQLHNPKASASTSGYPLAPTTTQAAAA